MIHYLPVQITPKKAISLSGIETVTAIVIATHRIRSTQSTFKEIGIALKYPITLPDFPAYNASRRGALERVLFP